jgi:hypothetical protein
MPVPTPADLLQPNGPVEPGFYPDDAVPPAVGAGSVNDRLQAYINRSVAYVATFPAGGLTDTDAAVLAWALYLAHQAAYTALLARPATENLGAMGLPSNTYSSEQLKHLRTQADAYKAEFLGLAVTPEGSTAAGGPNEGGDTPVCIRW